MLRFFLRLIGLALLAAAFALFVADATRAIAAGAPVFTSVRTALDWLSSASLPRLQVALEALHPLLWDPLAVMFLRSPVFLPLGGFAFLLLWLGARRADD